MVGSREKRMIAYSACLTSRSGPKGGGEGPQNSAPQGRAKSLILKLQAALKTVYLSLISVLHNLEERPSVGWD